MEKKYELLKDDWKEVDGQRVYRIRALKDFMFDPNDPDHISPAVRKGSLGGYIQQESNLSHEGDCWVGAPLLNDNTIVYGGSRVEGDGMVSGNILVKNSRITGFVYGNDSIIENSQVLDNSWLHNFNNGRFIGSHISGNAEISYGGQIENSVVAGNAKIEGGLGVKIRSSRINGSAMIFGEMANRALVLENTFVENCAVIRDGATVINSTVSDYAIIAGQPEIRDSYIAGKAGVSGKAKLDNAVVVGEALVYEEACISHSKIQDKAQVLGKATVEQSIVVDGARVSGEAVVRNYKVEGVAFSGKSDKGISDAEQLSMNVQPVLKNKAKETDYKNPVLERSEKKYELVMGEATTTLFDKKHYRIRALRDIPSQGVTAGQIGGYVESEKNLSHEGECWIAHNALASGDARVEGNAVVCGRATVMDNAVIKDNSMVSGFSVVAGDAVVGENAFVTSCAVVKDESKVLGHAVIKGNACVLGKSLIGESTIMDEAVVKDSRVWGGAEVSGHAVVTNRAVIDNGAKITGNDYVEGKTGIRQQNAAVKKLFQNERLEQQKKVHKKREETTKSKPRLK